MTTPVSPPRGETVLFGARVNGTATAHEGDLEQLERAAGRADLHVALVVATPRGPWEALGEVALGRRLGPETDGLLRLNPGNLGGGIEAAGRCTAVRAAGYAGSQAARRGP